MTYELVADYFDGDEAELIATGSAEQMQEFRIALLGELEPGEQMHYRVQIAQD